MSALHRFTFTSIASTLGLGLALSVAPVACQQPESYCTTAHGDFASIYKLKSGDPASACGMLLGDVIGVQTYFAPGGLNGTPKFSEPSMALLPAQLGDLLDRASSYDPPLAGLDAKQDGISIADFTDSFPDADDVCEGKKFNAAELTLPELPLIPGDVDDPETPDEDESTPDTPALPATSIRYEWSNVKVLVSANYQGTQFSADLKYTQDGCTAQYEVKGLYPLIGCAADIDCCSTEKECTTKVDGKTEILPLSSINPDFKVKCSTELGFCVLNDDFPALR